MSEKKTSKGHILKIQGTSKLNAIFFVKFRYAENHAVYGLVLVSACVTDLEDPNEKASGKMVPLLSFTKMDITLIAVLFLN